MDCGYSLEPPLYFVQKYEKYPISLSENFPFFGCKKFNIFE